jgi:hypothetical protein
MPIKTVYFSRDCIKKSHQKDETNYYFLFTLIEYSQ